MLKRILDAFRKDETDEDYLAIKTSVVENFIIRDLEAQVAYERDIKKGLQERIQELEGELEKVIKEKEEYRNKYIKADVDSLNQVVKNAKLKADMNNLMFRLQKFEGSPLEDSPD